jgi:hypothetical protein
MIDSFTIKYLGCSMAGEGLLKAGRDSWKVGVVICKVLNWIMDLKLET